MSARKDMVAASVALEPYEKKAHLRVELAEKEIWAKHEKKHAKHIIAQKQAKQKMSAATRNWILEGRAHAPGQEARLDARLESALRPRLKRRTGRGGSSEREKAS